MCPPTSKSLRRGGQREKEREREEKEIEREYRTKDTT
jgi:hypothetical protein